MPVVPVVPHAFAVPFAPPVPVPPLVHEAPGGPGWGGRAVGLVDPRGYLGCVDCGFIGQPGVAPPPYPYSGYTR